ncbi:MAG TPA: hypothetical protein GXZ29_04105 [Clostridiales bacterium]|jgi:hypothetical protein|nr:hypothetical protein [Clostridiales bacterium]
MDLKNISSKYRPIPFWSWNEKLDVSETKRQIGLMQEAGIGGYFMHARGGLQTEYMGEEWFDNIAAGVEEGKKRGIYAWAYDENGWPSGFGNGIVNGRGVAYQQKYLRFEKGHKQTEHTICNVDGYHFYYEVNPFYVDTLDGDVINVFIEEIYQPYYDRYKSDITGFFTDEPQISRNGIPWSFILPQEYQKAYGEDLLSHLPELFMPVKDYEKTRFQFWKLVTDLFSKNFMKQIYDWCEEHGLMLTGHLVLEETLELQLTSNGAVMPHFEYFHIPGMDWLGRPIIHCLTPLQVSSVAHQLGKKQILSETFALCGHNVGHDELKGILEWQMVRGITLLCQHLQGYSLRGIRKRDYPPAMYYQQPWWDDYKQFNDAMSRVGYLLTEGEVSYDTLLIHPQSTAWVCFDNDKNEGLEEYNSAFLKVVKDLEEKHILFHMGDETIMERHARVEGNLLVIGTQKYKTVILPPHKILFDSTRKLLEEFKKNGGVVTTADKISPDPIVDNKNITYTKRSFSEGDIYYFVNSTKEVQNARILVEGSEIDIRTGDTKPFNGTYEFMPFQSLIIWEGKKAEKEIQMSEGTLEQLDLSGYWSIRESTPNALTLDYCTYYFDDVLIEENGYVLNIQNRACELKRPVNIRCEYTVRVDNVPKSAFLVCETPDIYEISINGKPIEKSDCGYFQDTAFRKIDIAGALQEGLNTITLVTDFRQSQVVYENLEKSRIFESEKNKLTYDMEIEPIYIVGDFSVRTDGSFEKLEKDAVRYYGDFVIDKPAAEVKLSNMEQQGFPFFAGKLKVAKKMVLDHTDYQIRFNKKGINVIHIAVNGKPVDTLMWEPFSLDLSRVLQAGENEIEITLVNNLRNLLGPHHLKEGETYYASPGSFYKEPCIWNSNPEPAWDDNYCFVESGLITE